MPFKSVPKNIKMYLNKSLLFRELLKTGKAKVEESNAYRGRLWCLSLITV